MEYSLKLLKDDLNDKIQLLEYCKKTPSRFPPHIKENAIKGYNRKIEDLKNGIKILTKHVIMPRLIANKNYSEHQVQMLVEGKEYKALCKNKDCYCVIDETGDMEVFHKSFFNME